jgi:hypothetical protein
VKLVLAVTSTVVGVRDCLTTLIPDEFCIHLATQSFSDQTSPDKSNLLLGFIFCRKSCLLRICNRFDPEKVGWRVVGWTDLEKEGIPEGMKDGDALGESVRIAEGLLDGATEGTREGANEGDDVGIMDGNVVGHTDGQTEGKSLGDSVGESVGPIDGIGDGKLEGDSVGRNVGPELLGVPDGLSLGSVVGNPEGMAVGIQLGSLVGSDEGDFDGS